jgi:hypothetical protein
MGWQDAPVVNESPKWMEAPEVKNYTPNPTEGMSTGEKLLSGVGKGFSDTWRAVKEIANRAPSEEEVKRGGFLMPDGTFRPFKPGELEDRAKTLSSLQNEELETRQRDEPLLKTTSGTVGNITGKVASVGPLLAVPGTQGLAGAGLVGSLQGALEPTAEGESRGLNAAKGAVLNAGANLGLKLVGKAIKPVVDSSVQKLVNSGVIPTIGQTIGGYAKRAEDALTSVPIVGDLIKNAQKRSIEDFNTAAINRVLKPIGKSLEKDVEPGYQAVAKAHETVSNAYDELLPKMKASPDKDFLESLSSIKEATSLLPEAQAKQFHTILDHVINKRMTGDVATGDSVKLIQTELRQYAQKFSGKQNDANSQILGELLNDVKSSFDDLLSRQNPKLAGQLKNINTAYANLTRVERAAASTGAPSGVFTPSQLNTAVKAKDTSLNKRQFSQGKALMQDLSEAGKNVLSQKIPDSGTAYRMLLPYALGGGAAYASDKGYISPGTALAVIATAGAYSKPGQLALKTLLTERPDFIKNLSPKIIEKLGITRQLLSTLAPASQDQKQ